jgi:peptidoglycan/LPS O-acetylase OafA/YrhL
MDDSIKQTTSKIESIDGIRGLCALAVVLSHTFYLHNARIDLLGFKLITAVICAHGISSVLIFFMLSGLCIHLPVASGKKLNIGSFFVRRGIRILPTFIATYCLISYLKLNIKTVDFDAPTWSLWVEMIYYAAYPMLYFISSKITTQKLLAISIAISIAATCLLGFPRNFHGGNNIFQNAMMGLAYWVAGMLLAEILTKQQELKFPKFLLEIELWKLRALLILLDVAIFSFYYLFKLPYTVSFAIISPLLFLYVCREIRETRFNVLLTHIGIFSYSLYLFHQPLMQLLNYIDPEFSSGISALIFVIAICYIPYLLIEKPSIAIIQRLKNHQISNRPST